VKLVLNTPVTLLSLQQYADAFYINYSYIHYGWMKTYLDEAIVSHKDLIVDLKDSDLLNPSILEGIFNLFSYRRSLSVSESCIGIICDTQMFNITSLLPFVRKTRAKSLWVYLNYNDYPLLNDLTPFKALPNMRDINISFIFGKSFAALAPVKHEAEGRLGLLEKVYNLKGYDYPFEKVNFNLFGLHNLNELTSFVSSKMFDFILTSYPIKHGLRLRKLTEMSPTIPTLDFLGEDPRNLSFTINCINSFKQLLLVD